MTLKLAFPVLWLYFSVGLILVCLVYDSHIQFLNKCSHYGQYFERRVFYSFSFFLEC